MSFTPSGISFAVTATSPSNSATWRTPIIPRTYMRPSAAPVLVVGSGITLNGCPFGQSAICSADEKS